MIGKAKSISHVSNAINYAQNKIKAVEINRNKVIGENGKEIAKEFRVFQNLNSRCNRNSFSFVLSPSIEDGAKLAETDFAKIAVDFLIRMNLDQNQHISFLHKDKDHAHIHIFVNRIDAMGKAYKDNYIGKKAQRIAEKIALDWNFTTARKVQQEKESRLASQITKAHEMILPQKPRDIFEYAKMMKHYGIELHLKQASNGKVVGLKFRIGKESIKASSVHRSFSAASLQKTIQRNLKSKSIKI
ncbi:MAG: relaxase/mobilization nuclease domain-containing protein [Bacteroidetes bacterium]|nr:relaxase/mobilization nuclease domain-containing protein [Bacteroidota bacterium]